MKADLITEMFGGVPPVTLSSPYIDPIAAFLAEQDPPQNVIFPELLPVRRDHAAARRAARPQEPRRLRARPGGGHRHGALRARALHARRARIPVLYVQEEDPRPLTRPRLRAQVNARCGADRPEALLRRRASRRSTSTTPSG